MSSYTLYDYTESLDRVGISPADIKCVLAAWGENGDYAEWSGGFFVALKDKRFAYISGWCDTTGWGCQDGATIEYFDKKPKLKRKEWSEINWDKKSADLNLWHKNGCEEL